jgi:hypothetical protein
MVWVGIDRHKGPGPAPADLAVDRTKTTYMPTPECELSAEMTSGH